MLCPVLTSMLKILLRATLYKWQSIIPFRGIYDNDINHDELFGYLCGSHFSTALFSALQGLFLLHAGQRASTAITANMQM